MEAILWTWAILTALALVAWTSRHFQLSRAARMMPPLDSTMYGNDDGALPTVSLLVAAKDEAANIEACVCSLVAQDYSRLEIISVNDRSSDATGAILDRLAAESSRLTALHVRELRAGWFGKNNAMREGIERAGGEWLCFTDADCVQTCQRSLTIAMRYALEKGVDFLSVLPAHETKGFWESVIQPACSGIMMIWFNPLRVNNPARRTAYANGAFMLMRRSCYEAIGGHDAVKTELNEDMHMARRAKEAGQRLLVVSNVDLYTVRMYDGFAQTRAGWSRIFYGCFGTLRRLVATAVMVVMVSLLPWVALAASLVAVLLAAAPETPWRALLSASAATCLMQVTVMLRFYRLNRLHPGYALAYPLGVAIGLWALVGAIRRLGGRSTTTWRGTTYRGDRVEPPAQVVSAK
jgi:chlorobactene glucosyltransferase